MSNKLVIIEDDKFILDGLRILAETSGFEVATAANGRDGILAVQRERPDAIVCDVAMPGMSGFEVAEVLKSDAATRSIPIIFLTAKTGAADEQQGRSVGGAIYLKKPAWPHDILAAVNSVIKK